MTDDDNRTRVISNPVAPGSEGKTRVVSNATQKSGDNAATADAKIAEPRTTVFSGPRGDDMAEPVNDAFEPVVGWLVVVKGPGRGHSRQIHYGMNSLGRGAEERISLNFGDSAISREAHAYVVYDDKQKDFYIQHAGKSNLVRVNGKPVLTPMELANGDLVELGNTTLMFVPLCSDSFNWDEA